ncbi:hypothetical protein V6N13_033021 [Hibiscus sabdariffa]
MENLRQQIAEMRQSFFDEGILDKQFYQLELLEKRGNPNFVEEVLTIYFRESTTLLQTIEQAMAKAAFQELRNEHGNLRAKLELYFQQLRQACPAETALRPVPAEVILHDARPGDHRSRSC